MDTETFLARDIEIIREKARYDAACKKILSEKIILAWIMKSCLEEYKDCTVNEIAEKHIEGEPSVGETPLMPDETNAAPRIHGIGSEDVLLTEGKIVYDIRFIATAPATGELIRLIINIEAQGRSSVGYPLLKRAIYYCCRMISSQHGSEFVNEHYEKIKKVYSIFICTSPKKEQRNTITRYRMTEENMVGQVRAPAADYDLLTIIMLCLGGAEDESDGILKLLSVLLSNEMGAEKKKDILQNDFNIPMTVTMSEEAENMCNLSDDVWERGLEKGFEKGIAKGIEKGMEKGIEKGMEKGIEKGIVEGILSALRGLITNTGWSIEQAMAALSVPEADRPKYRELLQQQ